MRIQITPEGDNAALAASGGDFATLEHAEREARRLADCRKDKSTACVYVLTDECGKEVSRVTGKAVAPVKKEEKKEEAGDAKKKTARKTSKKK